MTLRILAVDDEPLALGRISQLLEQFDDVEVVAAVDSGVDAIDAIRRLRPDLALLDIEMPQMGGFDIVDALPAVAATGAPPPLIAFITAYPQFALEAFDAGAIDFLCKPVRIARLAKMLERARQAVLGREASRRLQELRGDLQHLREAAAQVRERNLWVRNKGELLRISAADVEWIEAQGAYVQLHLVDRAYLVRSSIHALAEQLKEEDYVRVHKSAVINRAKVVKITRGRGSVSVTLAGGADIRVGRKYRSALDELATARPGPGRR